MGLHVVPLLSVSESVCFSSCLPCRRPVGQTIAKNTVTQHHPVLRIPEATQTNLNFHTVYLFAIQNINFWNPAIHVNVRIRSGIWQWTRQTTSLTKVTKRNITNLSPLWRSIVCNISHYGVTGFIYSPTKIHIVMILAINLSVLGKVVKKTVCAMNNWSKFLFLSQKSKLHPPLCYSFKVNFFFHKIRKWKNTTLDITWKQNDCQKWFWERPEKVQKTSGKCCNRVNRVCFRVISSTYWLTF